MKTYYGFREQFEAKVVVHNRSEEGGCNEYQLPLRLDLANHSPSGFEWGYRGSGPAQLALALLADYSKDDEIAKGLYHLFKNQVIAQLIAPNWQLDGAFVQDWIEKTKAGSDPAMWPYV